MRFPANLTATLPVLLGIAVAPGLAVAQQAPPTFPTKDVSVVYKTRGGPAIQMSWLVAEQRVRIVLTGGPGVMLVDAKRREGFLLLDDQKAAMEMPPDDMPTIGQVPDGAKITKGKTETVAGHSCTVLTVEYQGARTRSCVTSDGVMLRIGPDGGPAGLEATKVIYGAQNPADFRVPEGYEVVRINEQANDNAPAAK